MADRAIQDITALVERLAGTGVLCVGDIMLDRFVHGSVTRVSPEAPIPVLRVEGETEMLGGVGNVARNAASLGAKATLLSAVGDDDPGRRIQSMIEAEPHISATLAVEPRRQTTVKTRYLSEAQQLLRADRETTAALSDAGVRRIEAAFDVAVAEHDAVVLSDYAKGVLDDLLLRHLIDASTVAGKPIVADPKSTNFERYRGVTLLTPNRAELSAASGMDCRDDDDIAAAAAEWVERAGVGAVLVTRGNHGMTLVAGRGEAVHLATDAREVFDVSGAGDTVVATLAAAFGAGADLADAARAANLAGGVAVAKTGTATVYPDELVHAFHADELRSADDKLCALQPALDRIMRWRRAGDRIGFTNGCFDLVHPGHISLLNQARAACDRLVVGLNTDASVKRLKGASRPIQNEHARAAVLAAFGAVDMVIVFSDDTPLQIIDGIRPDVLIKGADYTIDQVVGRDLVEGYGGRILLADLEPGHSTSETVLRLAGTRSDARG